MYQSESTFSNFENNTKSVQYAGFWLRFVAWIIDIIILAIPDSIIKSLLGASEAMKNVFVTDGRTFHLELSNLDSRPLFSYFLFSTALTWLYYSLMESSPKQATLGKMVLKLKVTDMDGRRISFGRATGRHFAKIISGLILLVGYMMAGWTEKKQALHDMIANTLVVKGNVHDVISEHTTTEGY